MGGGGGPIQCQISQNTGRRGVQEREGRRGPAPSLPFFFSFSRRDFPSLLLALTHSLSLSLSLSPYNKRGKSRRRSNEPNILLLLLLLLISTFGQRLMHRRREMDRRRAHFSALYRYVKTKSKDRLRDPAVCYKYNVLSPTSNSRYRE